MSDTSTDVWPPPPSRSWHLKGETLYQQYQGLDSRQSPNKELPTKILKHDRVKDRQDISQTLNFDRSHTILLTNKRCAGTQTQFSSFECPPDGEVVVINDTYRQQHQQQQQQQQQRPMVSPCHPQSRTVPIDMDTENVPLNLSVSNNCNNNNNNNSNSCLTSSSLVSSQQQQLRPSVITSTFTNRYYPNMNSYEQDSSPSRRELSGMSDPDEHFRRSLGNDYQKLNQPSPVEPLAKHISESNASVGSSDSEPDNLVNRRLILLSTQDNCPSVDDHFAKSLGNSTWSAIKAKRDESSESVDDHFAKALGDTWHRIKAEKENNCDTLRSSSPLQQSSSVSS